jgi:arylsulfatase A-like enzyme
MRDLWRKWLPALLLLLACSGCISPAAANRPNVLFLFSDDQRADTISALGNPYIQTPHLDKLVRRGFVFNRAYCMGSQRPAVCVPSRAMLLTGRGLFSATAGADSAAIPKEYPMWPEVLRAAGYKTIGIGKWHNDRPSFTRAFAAGGPILGGMGDEDRLLVYDYDSRGHISSSPRYVTNQHSSELIANAAIGHIKATRGTPFAMYLAFRAPHDPRVAPPGYAQRYSPADLPVPANFMPEHPFDNGEMDVRDENLLPRPRTRRAIKRELAAYYAMITHLDAQVGRILKVLRESGLADNTIIVYAADNGLALGSHGLLGKQNLYEHSMRVPLIMAGPGIPAGSSSALCYLYDVYPTIFELLGLSPPNTVQGKSLVPILRGEQQSVRDSIFCAYRDVQRMICKDRWKLIHYPKIGRLQLFDLTNDPDEMSDLSMDGGLNEQLVEMICELVWQQSQSGDPLAQPF